MRDPLFRYLYQIRTLEGEVGSDGKLINYILLLVVTYSFEDATYLVYEIMVSKLDKALNISTDDICPTKLLNSLGIDYLVAIVVIY